MAFRQPTRYAPPRIHIEAQESQDIQEHQPREPVDDSQEWILFSPTPPSISTQTHTTSTEQAQRTAGRSRLSDYGSLDTAARSYGYDEEGSEHTEAIAEDEDGELDSLDSHLHEFHAESNISQGLSRQGIDACGRPVLPTHDGLGSFRINQTMMGEGVQEHLYSFEKYNPRRSKRRRESLAQVDLEYDAAELDRIRRIEEWRIEQSRALLEEIRKETRRRRQSMSTERRCLLRDADEEELATMGSVHDEDGANSQNDASTVTEENEGFWTRITRKVIQDLIGIDDRMLSIIFGETLAEEDASSLDPRSSQMASERSSYLIPTADNDTWEYKLLERIARELGLLVHQLSEHPGAFSTYLKVHQMPLPYAGLPVIPEMIADYPEAPPAPSTAESLPRFQPTLPISTPPLNISGSSPAHDQDVHDINATPRPTFPIHKSLEADDPRIEFSKEEWEKQLDIKLVFRYLRSRFTSYTSPSSNFPRRNSGLAAASPQEVAARAARVQQHHPLVTRQASIDRRAHRMNMPASPILHRRSGSSCASQSTRKSAKRTSGSSRHYWDINGSMGSGSLIASTGAMGSWGEV